MGLSGADRVRVRRAGPARRPGGRGAPAPGRCVSGTCTAAYSREDAGREVCLRVGNAALALAGEPGGIALDVLGFIINSAGNLLPRSR
jgi:hypothetical protein